MPGVFERFQAGLVAAREHQKAGPSERSRALAKDTCRKNASVSQGLAGVEEHDVYITMESPVLEAIVEQDHIGMEEFHSGCTRKRAALADDYRDAWERIGQHDCLISGFLGIQQPTTAIRNNAIWTRGCRSKAI
jgi:hypothetical protein